MKIYHDLSKARIAYAEQNKRTYGERDSHNHDYHKEAMQLTYTNFKCELKDEPQLGYTAAQSVIIIRGVPGSGKSTYAKMIKTDDDIILDINDRHVVNGVYNYGSRSMKDAIAEQFALFNKHLANNDNIILVGSFTKPFHMSEYLYVLAGKGVEVFIVDLLDSYQNIHGVPDELVDKMKSNFEKVNDSILNTFQFIKSYNYIKDKVEHRYHYKTRVDI